MPKKKPLLPRPLDFNEQAFRFVRAVTGEPVPAEPAGKNPDAVKLGRKGGKKGGVARAEVLTPERRSEIAKKAAAKRWRDK